MNSNSPGGLGILGVIGLGILLLVLRRANAGIANVLLGVIGIVVVLVLLLVALIIFLLIKNPKGEKNPEKEEEKATLAKGRSEVLKLRQLVNRLQNRDIRRICEEIFPICDKILHVLKDKPENIGRVRQLFSYYLPTMSEILGKYNSLESSGVSEENTAEEVISCLGIIRTAMEKMYVNLFEGDKFDLSVEIEALKQISKRDGLFADEDSVVNNEE